MALPGSKYARMVKERRISPSAAAAAARLCLVFGGVDLSRYDSAREQPKVPRISRIGCRFAWLPLQDSLSSATDKKRLC